MTEPKKIPSIEFDCDDDREILTLKTDQGMPVTVSYSEEFGSIEYISLDGQNELDKIDDNNYAIFIQIKGHFFSLKNVLDAAENQISDILDEIRAERRAEQRNADFLSCPGRTGRI